MKIDIREKRFGGKLIFSSFSLDIPPRSSLFITGESGRGKTTLLRMMAGLDRDYEGTIESEKAVMLFQEDRLVENMGVLSNLLLVTDDRKEALSLLERAGLKGEENSIVSSLSGGMKRRVSIVRLLLLESDAYLFDEPFSGLDSETKKTVAAIIRDKTEDKTVVVVSHTDEDADLLGCNQKITL